MSPAAASDGGCPQWAVAYCAPGTKLVAAAILTMKGEQAGKIEEHPYLAGCGYLVLVAAELADRKPLDITWPLWLTDG